MKLRSLAALVVLTAASLIVLNCGGGSTSTGGSSPGPPISGVQACTNGTVASYLNTTCSQETTVYVWQSYTCTSVPSSICDNLGTNGSNLSMKMDPNGPVTILVGDTTAWNVVANQSVTVTITGQVYGATGNQNWPHFDAPNAILVGQTGDGTEVNTTTVDCGSNCTDSMDGVSTVPCNSTTAITNPAYCNVSATITPYPAPARFSAATSAAPYTLTIQVALNGGTNGTASLYSVGTHLGNL